ncbi:MAG: Rieske 2Fe-2S domain-containing protein [Pseudomonadota bacterium]
MSHQYKAVLWDGNKAVYDLILALGVVAYLVAFFVLGLQAYPSGHTFDPVILAMRALGSCAFVMLTVILMIGPLARLSPRFKPALYNRRHFGVMAFMIALAHGGLATLWYHGGGPLNPLVSLFVSNPLYDQIAGFPFEALGAAALIILFVMAATSHDFWLANLSAPVWKALHMLVYIAYGLLVVHITLGFLQTEKALFYPALTLASVIVVGTLHLAAGLKEYGADRSMKRQGKGDWVEVGDPMSIPENRAVIVPLAGGERIAVFRYEGKISAVTNACKHQNGPLGEGRIVDGCVTCPWHGWQFRPDDGVSPPPFTEKIATYDVKIENGRVFVDRQANPPGTRTPPAVIEEVYA